MTKPLALLFLGAVFTFNTSLSMEDQSTTPPRLRPISLKQPIRPSRSRNINKIELIKGSIALLASALFAISLYDLPNNLKHTESTDCSLDLFRDTFRRPFDSEKIKGFTSKLLACFIDKFYHIPCVCTNRDQTTNCLGEQACVDNRNESLFSRVQNITFFNAVAITLLSKYGLDKITKELAKLKHRSNLIKK